MNLFFHDSIHFASCSVNELFELPTEEAIHAVKVLRLQMGDQIFVTDGKGGLADCIVSSISKNNLVASISSIKISEPKSYSLIMAVAPTKNMARFEWFLEKATEIGIDEIYPMECKHSERRNFNTERTNKIITAAVKQSLKSFHPILHELTRFDDILKLNNTEEKYMAHLESDKQISLKEKLSIGKSVLILIGPEGDFSKDEVLRAKNAGFEIVSLGNSRLRTETAALYSCFTVNNTNL